MSLGEEAYEAALANAGPDDSQTLQALNNLGVLYQMTGDWQQPETYFRQTLDGRLRVSG